MWLKILTICLMMVAGVSGVFLSVYMHRNDTKELLPLLSDQREYHHPVSFVDQVKDRSDAGEIVYHEYCASCHALKPMIPLGAPRIKQQKDWLPYLQQGRLTMLKRTIDGYGKMPARGGCFECTDEMIAKAIDYLLPGSTDDAPY